MEVAFVVAQWHSIPIRRKDISNILFFRFEKNTSAALTFPTQHAMRCHMRDLYPACLHSVYYVQCVLFFYL